MTETVTIKQALNTIKAEQSDKNAYANYYMIDCRGADYNKYPLRLTLDQWVASYNLWATK